MQTELADYISSGRSVSSST